MKKFLEGGEARGDLAGEARGDLGDHLATNLLRFIMETSEGNRQEERGEFGARRREEKRREERGDSAGGAEEKRGIRGTPGDKPAALYYGNKRGDSAGGAEGKRGIRGTPGDKPAALYYGNKRGDSAGEASGRRGMRSEGKTRWAWQATPLQGEASSIRGRREEH